ncbi:hypothetical protein K488DRAFT_68600 [Vararia minispora EC-137]|uniref:Uncharacterized protein n=1 Tax=Vararia minispora EC-137 TaxID=1314806 RepID=A0ACB8QTP5_9AGAM|nr:hypothetical protein K488DRAFT_68600 [Vararia minispora EC-137]
MAVMCERVTLPPISSLDFDFSSPRNAQPRLGRDDSPRGPDASSRLPSAHYQRSSWDARRPSSSGHPLPTQILQHDGRPRPHVYDTPTGASLPSPPSSVVQRPSPHPFDDRRPHSSPTTGGSTIGMVDSHHQRISHARNTSQISAASADTWSQYDSEHPDSPDVRVRSVSPGTAGAPHVPGPSEAETEVRFIYATPGESHLSTAVRKRKVDDVSSSDEGQANEAEGSKSVQREQADGRRKYKKMMNVRHYRAQTKDALQSLRDVLPESIRPLERQARSFTVVNGTSHNLAVKHIENLTAQLERLQRENREQGEQLELSNERELALSAKVVELERALAVREKQSTAFQEQAPVAQHEGDSA